MKDFNKSIQNLTEKLGDCQIVEHDHSASEEELMWVMIISVAVNAIFGGIVLRKFKLRQAIEISVKKVKSYIPIDWSKNDEDGSQEILRIFFCYFEYLIMNCSSIS